MNTLSLALLATAVAATATVSLAQDRRVYAGREAQALQCAAYYSYTAHVGEELGLLSTSTADKATRLALYILDTYVGGSDDQKVEAYRVILSRMPQNDKRLFDETMKYIGWCEKTFLK